jgi:predicted metal-dependent HD superfamily phosphohydrolase
MDFQKLLDKYKIKIKFDTLLDRWNESNRHYHNLNHLIDLNRMILEDYANNKITSNELEKLYLVALFHDIVYDVNSKNNESKSAEFFMSLCIEKDNADILEISEAILNTATHTSTNMLSEKFNKYDMNIVERDFDSLLEWENGISAEYSIFKEEYKPNRILFLESLLDKYPLNSGNLIKLIEHVENN